MKYIRTKDGIYEYVDYDNECIIPMPIIKYKEQLTHCAECDIIKQADTIEELCDELVFEWQRSSISHDNDVWHLYHEISLKEEVGNALTDGYRESKEEVKNIYGAIWTDKGLQFVARMNSKGELELL